MKTFNIFKSAPKFLQRPIHWIMKQYRSFTALSWQRKTMIIASILLVFLVILPLATYAYYARDIRDPERLMNRKDTGVVLLDRNGEVFYTYYQAKAIDSYTKLEDIPEHMHQALVATEDRDFYNHGGFSFRSIIAAAYRNITNGDLDRYGGSTITQQLVKNSLLGNEKTYFRKYQELFLSIAVDRQYDKDKILEMYLNSVYFGEGTFGVESAANTYFNKSPSQLTLEESSMLIGLLPAPSKYSPVSGDKDLAKGRQQIVLSAMVEEGYITNDQRLAAIEVQLTYHVQKNDVNATAPHYALMVLEELEEKYGEEQIARSGFTVTTSLDLSMQRNAEETVRNQISSLEANNASNGSFIAINPNTGEILALVGSVDWMNEKFGKVNMTTTPRQPGSSFKPVYYTEALDKELITPATIVRDEPTTFGNNYKPENYDSKYRGKITIRNSLSRSLNIPSVKVMQKLGVSNAVGAAERMGATTLSQETDYGLSLALGTGEMKLLELANVYAAFANGGEQFTPATITSIKDKYSNTLFTYKPGSKKVISKSASFLISSILSDQEARAPTFGNQFNLGYPFAVKTGTTQDSRDAWTFGYTPNVVMGAWVGNNNNEKMTGVGGSSAAGPIIVDMTRLSSQELFGDEFEQPPDVVEARVCHGTEQIASTSLAKSFTEFFKEGTVFKDKCFSSDDDDDEEKEEDEEDENDPTDDQPENQPPSVTASATPKSGEAPLEVSFTSDASDSDGEISTVFWDFGDGTTSTEENPTHVYEEPGTYTATVTVTDNNGATSSDSVTIKVIKSGNAGGDG